MSAELRELIFGQGLRDAQTATQGGIASQTNPEISVKGDAQLDRLDFRSEPGIRLEGRVVSTGERGTALVLGSDAKASATESQQGANQERVANWIRGAGLGRVEIGLRAIGSGKPATQVIAGVPDHNEAEWSLWVGRPLLGQWVVDTIRWITALDELRIAGKPLPSGRPVPPRPYALAAAGSTSLVALLTAALDPRVESVFVSGCLVSFVANTDRTWSHVPMGVLVPNLLDVADVPQIAGLIAPRQLVIADGVYPEGDVVPRERMNAAFAWTRGVYNLLDARKMLEFGTEAVNQPGLQAK